MKKGKTIRVCKCGQCKTYFESNIETKKIKCPSCGKIYKAENVNNNYELIEGKEKK